MPFDGTVYEQTEVEMDLATLRTARKGIARPGGWRQGGFGEGESRCMAGWLWGARIPSRSDLDRLQGMIYRELPWWAKDHSALGSIAAYNDSWWRRQKDVVRLFDRAIIRLEARDALAS